MITSKSVEALRKLREAIESDDRSPRYVDVIDDSAGTTGLYLDVEIDGEPYRLTLEEA